MEPQWRGLHPKLIRSRKTRVSAVVATAAVWMGIMAGPAAAQSNEQAGLVNVNIQDTAIQIPVGVGVAANVCGVNAAVLAADLNQDGSAECTATADQAQNLRARVGRRN